ncbi:M18 family aminopeptidase [Candidatus Endobugula sertula]|uniref:M18 family aminopeptidase n=1 Tax=Candidatus Endobugula sertula TaxID=62101 RepID=A0A1D2QQ78_9GAMM|nr:M18 family aminopeptidase [Candidatus Endobugula sertula]
MDQDHFNAGLLNFINASPTPFHATQEMARQLLAAGFIELLEDDAWSLEVGQRYFLTRNFSSIIAFVYAPDQLPDEGIRMVGAHTDSPCLKVKPNPEIHSHGYFQLGVEVYGGALLNPWFDRDLSLAGRVNYLDQQQQLKNALVDFKDPVAVIPSLAIHLHREANSGNIINQQKHLPPVLMQVDDDQNPVDFRDWLHAQLQSQRIESIGQILDYELSLYDTQPAAMIGLQKEFVAAARLDNLLSCYVGLQALLAANTHKPALLVCNDHEEVGSASACGAQGPMLEQCLQRMIPDLDQRLRTIGRSLMISTDNVHGIHPNYADKHDQHHGPLLNQGPVIKTNVNQHYATNSETSSFFRQLCQQNEVTPQVFVTRSDLKCGSTIGPITATSVGVKTIDIGLPSFAMHSIRELAGAKDAIKLARVLSSFYQQ